MGGQPYASRNGRAKPLPKLYCSVQTPAARSSSGFPSPDCPTSTRPLSCPSCTSTLGRQQSPWMSTLPRLLTPNGQPVASTECRTRTISPSFVATRPGSQPIDGLYIGTPGISRVTSQSSPTSWKNPTTCGTGQRPASHARRSLSAARSAAPLDENRAGLAAQAPHGPGPAHPCEFLLD